ncbi:MAG: hypothetical protein GWN30_31840, partial [Gammaproteobacteria bacterium]|nr:hypothetical protein [Gammaproteobacteria bacterium]
MTKVHLFLLGRFRIERKNKEIQLSTRKAESLLAYLVLNPGSHAREKLASLFWGDSSDTAARNSLRNALAVVNRAIGSGLLLADRQVVEINPDNPLWVDALEFKQHAAQFLEEPHLEQVLVDFDLYRGDLLSDFYDDWIYPLREQYRSLLLETLVLKTEHMRSQSEYDRAIQYANKTLEHDQANERAHQHLMFCYMAQGNRSAALQQFESCKLALWEELGVEPAAATVALYKWIKQAPEELKPLSAQITNLPIPLTSFIGRKTQTAEIKQLLSSTRLLTITGAGGSGKTRLAIQVATDLLDAFNDGVWWVDLSSLNDESLLPQKVAKVLGVTEVAGQLLTETLVNQLESKQLLLLVDNCEHLIDASSRIIHHLLKTCPQLK